MILEDVLYLTQVDNKLFPGTTCYPTSLSMAIQYCLDISGNTKGDIGCKGNMQLEDYITEITQSSETKAWIKENISKYGAWMFKYKPRTIAVVEEYIFNELMNEFGFKAIFKENITFSTYQKLIQTNELPIVLHGKFGGIRGVFGHICCGVGWEAAKIVVHDPFGNAELNKYRKNSDGWFARYPLRYFVDKNGFMKCQIIVRG